MLQQTQVRRVIPKYKEFLRAFPTVYDLAAGKTSHILTVWKGMGYNRRALYLQKTAILLVKNYDGIFPKDMKKLLKLPGLGKYTARAILVFSFMENTYLVDTNIRKIITHFFYSGIVQKESEIERIAKLLVPKDRAWEWHQALMDYGAIHMPTILKRTKTPTRSPTSSVPFKQTNRYFRGKIIDLLREKDTISLQAIQTCFMSSHKNKQFFRTILTSLAKDGLITYQSDDTISLPK